MKVAIVFGGVSFEHEISIVSSIAMKDVLKEELVYLFLDASRDMYHIPTDIINLVQVITKNLKKFIFKKVVFIKKVDFLLKKKV